MRCVQIDGTGAVVDVVPQPADVTTCTLVIQSGVEAAANPLLLTEGDAVTIGGAIFALWGFAYGVKLVIRHLWGS